MTGKKTIYLTYIILCISLGVAQITPEYLLTDGGTGDDTNSLYIARWPFYNYGEGATCSFTATITNPENKTYHTNTHNLNTTTTGTPPLNCQYKINNNAYNNYTCNGNKCSQQITYPEGPVTITIECTDSIGCTATTTQQFTIKLFTNGKLMKNSMILFLLPILYLIIEL